MDGKIMLMRRTSLRALGCVLTDQSIPVEQAMGEDWSEEEILRFIFDDLHQVIRHEQDHQEERAKEVVEMAWEEGRKFGFLDGMRAGARVALSLTGAGQELF